MAELTQSASFAAQTARTQPMAPADGAVVVWLLPQMALLEAAAVVDLFPVLVVVAAVVVVGAQRLAVSPQAQRSQRARFRKASAAPATPRAAASVGAPSVAALPRATLAPQLPFGSCAKKRHTPFFSLFLGSKNSTSKEKNGSGGLADAFGGVYARAPRAARAAGCAGQRAARGEALRPCPVSRRVCERAHIRRASAPRGRVFVHFLIPPATLFLSSVFVSLSSAVSSFMPFGCEQKRKLVFFFFTVCSGV